MNASLHTQTPTLSVIDGRDLPVRQVAFYRTTTAGLSKHEPATARLIPLTYFPKARTTVNSGVTTRR